MPDGHVTVSEASGMGQFLIRLFLVSLSAVAQISSCRDMGSKPSWPCVRDPQG